MATSLTAYYKNNLNFSFTDTITQSKNNATSSITSNYTYGTGAFKAEAGVYITGLLASGGYVEFDLTQMSEDFFGVSGVVLYSGIKFIGIANTTVINTDFWPELTGTNTVETFDMTVTATGLNGLSGLFNGNSGNVMINPYSTFSYNDPYSGIRTSPENKKIQINAMGSGALYSLTILGSLQ